MGVLQLFRPAEQPPRGASASEPTALRARFTWLTTVGVLLLMVLGAYGGTAQASISTSVPDVWPKCGVFHPVTKVASSVPVLGSGEANLGWGTAHPADLSNGGTATGTVVCITWTRWATANALGRGWGEVYGPNNTRPTVQIELHAFDLGRCRAGDHLAYKRLYLREPSVPGGKDGPWVPWETGGYVDGDICVNTA